MPRRRVPNGLLRIVSGTRVKLPTRQRTLQDFPQAKLQCASFEFCGCPSTTGVVLQSNSNTPPDPCTSPCFGPHLLPRCDLQWRCTRGELRCRLRKAYNRVQIVHTVWARRGFSFC